AYDARAEAQTLDNPHAGRPPPGGSNPNPDLVALTESGAVPIVVSGPDGAVLAANQAALRLLGRTEAELVGARIDDLVGAGGSDNALGPRPDRVRATPLPTPPEAGIIWVLDGEQQIRDDLTGLANRRLYQDRLAHAIATARRRQEGFAVCVLDLNAFKDVNDMLGYDLGDVLLRMLGERLAEALRASDTLARVGGDEFAIILPSCDDAEAAATVAGKLITELQRPFEIEGREVDVTASLGIAIYPRDGESAEHL